MNCNLDGICIKDILKNKDQYIKDKKAVLTNSDNVVFKTEVISTKADGDNDIISIRAVGNLLNYADSYTDVLTDSSFNKTINDNDPSNFKMLKNHLHNLDGVIGTIKSIGIEKVNTPKYNDVLALVFEADINKTYDEKLYNMFKSGDEMQFSIGFNYVKLDLAVNDEDYKDEFAAWQSYYDKVLNKDVVDAKGYFWKVSEVKLHEISAVLFAANDQSILLDTDKDIDIVDAIKKIDFFDINDINFFN